MAISFTRVSIVSGGEVLDNIITELINIENKAREVSLVTDEEIKRLPKRIEEQKKLIDEEIAKDTEEKLKRIHEMALAEADEKVSHILVESQDKFAQVEKMYEQVHEKLENDIFQQIIGR